MILNVEFWILDFGWKSRERSDSSGRSPLSFKIQNLKSIIAIGGAIALPMTQQLHLAAIRSKNLNRESRESTRIGRIHEGLFNPFVLIRVIRGKNLTGCVF